MSNSSENSGYHHNPTDYEKNMSDFLDFLDNASKQLNAKRQSSALPHEQSKESNSPAKSSRLDPRVIDKIAQMIVDNDSNFHDYLDALVKDKNSQPKRYKPFDNTPLFRPQCARLVLTIRTERRVPSGNGKRWFSIWLQEQNLNTSVRLLNAANSRKESTRLLFLLSFESIEATQAHCLSECSERKLFQSLKNIRDNEQRDVNDCSSLSVERCELGAPLTKGKKLSNDEIALCERLSSITAEEMAEVCQMDHEELRDWAQDLRDVGGEVLKCVNDGVLQTPHPSITLDELRKEIFAEDREREIDELMNSEEVNLAMAKARHGAY
ncbi:hypothetical protein FRC07_002376 [Ceratobasidium sp. 392]|nr:hypothetical protein FRC07_002376 [Ceratobasidium sp. 392]